MHTNVTIKAEERFGASTHYHLEVHSQVGLKTIQNKTYAEFETLYRSMNRRHKKLLSLPAKKGTGDSKKQRLESTRSGLERWMNSVLARQDTAGDPELCGFINTSPNITTHGFSQPTPEQQNGVNTLHQPRMPEQHNDAVNTLYQPRSAAAAAQPPFQTQDSHGAQTPQAEVQPVMQQPVQPDSVPAMPPAQQQSSLQPMAQDRSSPQSQEAAPSEGEVEDAAARSTSAAPDPFVPLPMIAEPPSPAPETAPVAHAQSPPQQAASSDAEVQRLPSLSLSPSLNAADFMNQLLTAVDSGALDRAPSAAPAAPASTGQHSVAEGEAAGEAAGGAAAASSGAEGSAAGSPSLALVDSQPVPPMNPLAAPASHPSPAEESKESPTCSADPQPPSLAQSFPDPSPSVPLAAPPISTAPLSPQVDPKPLANAQPSPPLEPPPWTKEMKKNNQISQKWGGGGGSLGGGYSSPRQRPKAAEAAEDKDKDKERGWKMPSLRPVSAKPPGYEEYSLVAYPTGKTPRGYPAHLDLHRLVAALPARGPSEPESSQAVLPQFTPVPGRGPKSLYKTSPSRPAGPPQPDYSPPIHRSHGGLGPSSASDPWQPSPPAAPPPPARAPSSSKSGAPAGVPKPLPKGTQRTLSPGAFEGQYSGTDEEMVAAWIQDVTQEQLQPPLQEALKSGVLLCNLVNKLRQGRAISRISKLNLPFPQRENIASFCAAARDMGVPDRDNFTTDDLYDGKNLKQVLQCIFSLGRNAYYIPDWNGPCLGKPEPIHEKRVWKRG